MITGPDKQAICKRFTLGEDLGAIAANQGLHKRTVEAILREAFIGLIRLNDSLGFKAIAAAEAAGIGVIVPEDTPV